MTNFSIARTFTAATDPKQTFFMLEKYLFKERGIAGLDVRKTWPKPGNRFVILYDVAIKDKKIWVFAFLFPPEKNLPPPAIPRNAAHVPEWNGFFQKFPYDFRMPHLKTAVTLKKALSVLRPLLDEQERWKGFDITKVKARGYWPGKRCQIEYKGVHPYHRFKNFFSKVYREENGRDTAALHTALLNAGFDGKEGLTVPRPIAYCPQLRAALLEPGKGRMLMELMDSSSDDEAFAAAGRMIASLHKSKISLPNPEHKAEDEIRLLKGWESVLRLFSSSKAEAAAESIDTLIKGIEAAERPVRTSHRDFYDKQLLFDGKEITLLDLDTACPAPPELDAGNFIAHLVLRGIQQGDKDRHKDLEEIFLESYRKSGGSLCPKALKWFTASSLLRLACHYTLQPGGAEFFRSLINRTESTLSAAGGRAFYA